MLGAFISYLFPDADVMAGLQTVPPTIGEIWIIGYLIIFGVRGTRTERDVTAWSRKHARAAEGQVHLPRAGPL